MVDDLMQMHSFDKYQYSRILREGRNATGKASGAEICGLIVDTGHHLSFVLTRNASSRVGSFVLSRRDVRRVAAAVKVLGQEIVGTFHSHPMSLPVPGASDIKYAVDDSLMFICDCIGRKGRLWRIKQGRARELKFGFI
ncbi:MAG: Mov34/MPN/PAD-1 family protein [Verrucomicrobia bacterium]|nr:Mov34/MPN/PAD-1 family protein [Verrucomicrobiota bacterium]